MKATIWELVHAKQVLLIVATVGGFVPPAIAASAEAPWRLIAQAHFVVIGIAAVPVRDIEVALRSGKSKEVDIAVRVEKCLKPQTCPKAYKVSHPTYRAWYSVNPDDLISLHGKQAVFFLVQIDNQNTGFQRTYFAGDTPLALQKYSPELEQQIDAELKFQATALRNFHSLFPGKRDPAYPKVKRLLDAMLIPSEARIAYRRLEAMGEPAVPAMTMFLKDRREIPVKRMSFRNKAPDAFEGIRHTEAENVGAAIELILNQITGERFGRVAEGASDRERAATIDGWRIYLYRTRYRGSQDATVSRP